MSVNSLPVCASYRAGYISFDYKSMFQWHFIARYIWVCCLDMFLKNCCLDGISFFVCWACITCVTLKSRERLYLHCMSYNGLFQSGKLRFTLHELNGFFQSGKLRFYLLTFNVRWKLKTRGTKNP